MGELAASGGYYISMGACSLVATPFTFTGSIGVIFGKPNLKGLYDKLGITRQSLQRGKRASISNEYRYLSEDEKKFLYGHLERIYNDFVAKVAQSRKMSVEAAEAVSKGRLWIGIQAKDNGLVDVEGGLIDAISLAKIKAGIPQNEEPEIIYFPKKKKLMEFFIELAEISSHSQTETFLEQIDNYFNLFETGEPLMLYPVIVSIK